LANLGDKGSMRVNTLDMPWEPLEV
jgi:hypothetical protein